MTTPVSGQISFSSLRSQIFQTGSGPVSLNAAATRLGYIGLSNQQSRISDLYLCWGANVTSSTWTDKFYYTYYGFSTNYLTGEPVYGNIDYAIIMPGMNLNSIYTTSTNGTLVLYYPGGTGVSPYIEYKAASVARIATADELKTITSTTSDGSVFEYAYFSNGTNFPASGTFTFGIKFNEYTGGGGYDPGSGGGFNCCFSGDTEVTMSDHSIKLINTIEVGDQILSYNHDTEQHETNEVSEVVTRVNQKMYEFHLANGTKIKGSHDHPFYVIGKGYCSMNPELTMIGYKEFTNVSEIEVGDSFIDKNGSGITVEQILPIEFYDTVYTFKNKIRTSPNYYANGVLVY